MSKSSDEIKNIIGVYESNMYKSTFDLKFHFMPSRPRFKFGIYEFEIDNITKVEYNSKYFDKDFIDNKYYWEAELTLVGPLSFNDGIYYSEDESDCCIINGHEYLVHLSGCSCPKIGSKFYAQFHIVNNVKVTTPNLLNVDNLLNVETNTTTKLLSSSKSEKYSNSKVESKSKSEPELVKFGSGQRKLSFEDE